MKQLLILSLLLLGFFSCSTDERRERANHLEEWQQAQGKIKVLSTLEMINDIVKEIGGDHIASLTLIKGQLDPHSYQLVKGDDEKLAAADLIFFNGLGLEHGPSLQHYLQGNPKAIALGDSVLLQFSKEILQYQSQLDPHIWMDISLWAKTIPVIVGALSKQSPENAAEFRANGAKLTTKMHTRHLELRQLLTSIPEQERFLVTSHDAFNYFARAYLATDEERLSGGWQKRFAAPEGLAPDSQLNPVDIQIIIDHLKKYDIHVLFPESNISKDSIRKIVDAGEEKGLKLRVADAYLYGDAMGQPGSDGDTYLKMMKHNAMIIRKNLSE